MLHSIASNKSAIRHACFYIKLHTSYAISRSHDHQSLWLGFQCKLAIMNVSAYQWFTLAVLTISVTHVTALPVGQMLHSTTDHTYAYLYSEYR